MSFHRGGYYAVNMGLDSDNIMRIGGWSASANRWELDMSGNNWANSSFRSPVFYDSNDTGYYVDPNSTSNFSTVQTTRTYGFTDIRSPIFYDYDNTGYYVDPASTSNLNAIIVASDIQYSSNSGYGILSANGNRQIAIFNAGVTFGYAATFSSTATATDFILSSDTRLKTNITPIMSAVTKLNTITGYTFEFIKDSGKRRSGVLAQEIQDILPEAVYTDADGYLSVSYDAIIPLLIQAIKEQQTKIEELETVITRK